MDSEPVSCAILFADLADSTALYVRYGDAAAQRIVFQCLALMTHLTTQSEGIVVKTLGDAVMSRFASAKAAVEAACAMQRYLAEQSALREPHLALRIGLHFGPVLLESEDVFGDAVNVAAHVAEIARAEQILTTQATVEQLTSIDELNVRQFDVAQIRGHLERMELFEVLWDRRDVTTIIMRETLIARALAQSLQIVYQGAEYRLASRAPAFLMGRAPQCDLKVEANCVSRVHARIEYQRGKFVFIDNSTNGSFIRANEEREIYLRRETLPLSGGGEIGLGSPPAQDASHVVRYRLG